jgi:hypothetical protein
VTAETSSGPRPVLARVTADHSSLGDVAPRAVLQPNAATDQSALSPEPLSPELVLVCPQLRPKALAALPDRPWEAFLPVRSEDPPAAVVAAGSITAGSLVALPSDDPVAAATADSAAADFAVEPVDGRGGSGTASVSRRGRDFALVTVALIVGFIAAQFVHRPAPTSLMPSAGGPPSTSPEAPANQPPRALSSPGQGAAGRAPTLTGGRHSSVAVPQGGYIFGRSGRFQIARDVTAVRMFHAGVKCARKLVIPTISLRDGSRFSYRGAIGAGTKTSVRLEVVGRFLNPRQVRGFIRARSAGCDSGNVHFLARLS